MLRLNHAAEYVNLLMIARSYHNGENNFQKQETMQPKQSRNRSAGSHVGITSSAGTTSPESRNHEAQIPSPQSLNHMGVSQYLFKGPDFTDYGTLGVYIGVPIFLETTISYLFELNAKGLGH